MAQSGRSNWPMQMPAPAEYKNYPAGYYKHQYTLVDNKVLEVKNVIVHKFEMGDVEDPDLYAAEPLLKWQNSESGKWVMEHAVETPMWHRNVSPITYGHSYAISAKLQAKDYTYWTLKWGNDLDKK